MKTIPAEWTFRDREVAAAFDAHVREQLPWYDLATGAAAHLARHYIPQGGLVYDIGASTGNFGRAIAATLKARDARLVAIDNAPEMAERYEGPGEIVVADATQYPFGEYDVAVCFLVLMFLPPAKRRDFLRLLVTRIRPGGALIFVDKEAAPSGYLGTAMHRITIAGKIAAGADPAKVIDKELSLSGVQRPLSPRFVQTVVPEAVEFFRFGEFAGYIVDRAD